MKIERVRPRPSAAGRVLLLAVALAWGCAAVFATKIGDIEKTPGRYDGRTVTIAGKVTATHDLLVVKYYEVNDGTGEIAVVTDSALPKEGERVRIKGKVKQAFAIGTAHLVVIVEEPPSR